jgi:hypothetical protein
MHGELDKNLSELEANVWPEPDFDSVLVRECHRLRKSLDPSGGSVFRIKRDAAKIE